MHAQNAGNSLSEAIGSLTLLSQLVVVDWHWELPISLYFSSITASNCYIIDTQSVHGGLLCQLPLKTQIIFLQVLTDIVYHWWDGPPLHSIFSNRNSSPLWCWKECPKISRLSDENVGRHTFQVNSMITPQFCKRHNMQINLSNIVISYRFMGFEDFLKQGWGTFFLPRVIFIFAIWFMGHTKWIIQRLYIVFLPY